MDAHSRTILLVEDDPRLSRSLSDQFTAEGFRVWPVFDGDMAQRAIAQGGFDLALLDLGLPGADGYALCRAIRDRDTDIPVLVLTAFSDIESKTQAFDIGADDYLVKPVHFKELLAKVRVFLKRSASNPAMASDLRVADLVLHVGSKTVERGGKTIELSPKEFSLLALLMRNKDRVVSKDDIAERVWDDSHSVSPNTIEVYVSFLRGKVDKGFDTKLIHTRHGFGYVLSEHAP